MDLVRYIRVSKVAGREGDSFQSPTQQRKGTDAIVSLTPGARVVADFEDMDESGGTMNRPGARQAIQMVESGQADGIVVAYLDRWARTLEALEMIERWAAEGKTFISARERFDATTSQGKFALGMMLLVAKFYRDQITERWDESVRDSIERGVHGRVPYGYRRTNGKGSALAIAPTQAAVVKRIYDERLAGHSDALIARELNADGVASASGGRWTRQAVRALLAVKTYTGTAHKGRHERTDAHPAIIPLDKWTAAQQDAMPPTQNGRYLLSGLARCGGCGYALVGGTDTSGRRYRCAKNHAAFRCPAPTSAPVEGLDALAIDAFFARYGDIRMQAADAAETAPTEAGLQRARTEYETWRDDTELREAIGGDDYRAGLIARKHAVVEAERAHGDAIRTAQATVLRISGDIWDALDKHERRDVMRAGIDAIVVRRAKSTRSPLTDRVELVWAGELEHDGTSGAVAAAVRNRNP